MATDNNLMRRQNNTIIYTLVHVLPTSYQRPTTQYKNDCDNIDIE